MLGESGLTFRRAPDLLDDDRLGGDWGDSKLAELLADMSIRGKQTTYVILVDIGRDHSQNTVLVDRDLDRLTEATEARALGERVLRILFLCLTVSISGSKLSSELT